jgi:hypothetical protein
MKKTLTSRTVRVYEEDWSAILTFFRTSPDGTTGSEVIRDVISLLGDYCRTEMEAGNAATLDSPEKSLRLIYDRIKHAG